MAQDQKGPSNGGPRRQVATAGYNVKRPLLDVALADIAVAKDRDGRALGDGFEARRVRCVLALLAAINFGDLDAAREAGARLAVVESDPAGGVFRVTGMSSEDVRRYIVPGPVLAARAGALTVGEARRNSRRPATPRRRRTTYPPNTDEVWDVLDATQPLREHAN